ncbi:MAG: flagellar basal body P-ring protein FlgI [Bacteroidota bacterium]
MKRYAATIILMTILGLSASWGWASPSRIKDIASVQGQGRHKLLGYGLVAGLGGTGDSDTGILTSRSLTNMLEKLGLTVSPRDFKGKNLAAVIVTAELPPVATVGATLDVTVSSLADAKSLQGGTLLLTPLCGADGEVYATAQGSVTIGGFNIESSGGDKAQKNHATVGRVPNGASIVKPLVANAAPCQMLSLLLLQPDYTTAVRVAEAINKDRKDAIAVASSQSTVQVAIPAESQQRLAEFIVSLENLPVEPDGTARVVLNERTGTVVIGAHVRIMPVAICHGGLTIEVKSETQVSQPPPRVDARVNEIAAPAVVDPTEKSQRDHPGERTSVGQTVVTRQDDLRVSETGGSIIAIPEQATLQDLVTALDALGVKPRDLIAIIQALKEAGALQADLVLL